MVRTAWMLTRALVVVFLVLFGAGQVMADPIFVSPPVVSYYYPPPTVAYYSPPVVYTPAPAVSYYYGAPFSYYTPPVSYYAAPAAVTTIRYGLFGRPWVTTYYPPVYLRR